MLKIKFEENKLNVPVVKFTLGDGSVYKALIDTGSMISLIGKEFPVLQKDKRKIEIVTVNGTKKEKVNASFAEIYFCGETSFLILGIQMDLKNVI